MTSKLKQNYEADDHLLKVRSLYDKYAGMLLGYILEVVKDNNEAERILISVFSELHQHLHELGATGTNTFSFLQSLARKRLIMHLQNSRTSITSAYTTRSNKYLSLLGEEQYKVFCGLHYDGKTTAILAQELDKTPDAIRIILKEAFNIIRKGHQA